MSSRASWSASPEDATEIFPQRLTKRVPILEYPKNFIDYASDPRFTPFILYENDSNILYYKKVGVEEKYIKHLKDVGKESKQMRQPFRPAAVDWSQLHHRYSKPPDETFRKNVDLRVGFKIGNRYLVKAYFTFGQRTVGEGEAHVYQTLEVPLVFCLLENERHRARERSFPREHMHKYDRRILEPNGRFRIGPGTTYLVLSLQKTLFRVDVVNADARLPFECADPVRTRVTRLPRDVYDRPVATPFIDDLRGEDRGGSSNSNDDDQQQADHHFVVPSVPDVSSSRRLPSNSVSDIWSPLASSSHSVRPRAINVVSPDIVEHYGRLKRQRFDCPPVTPVSDREEDDEGPLDLSKKTTTVVRSAEVFSSSFDDDYINWEDIMTPQLTFAVDDDMSINSPTIPFDDESLRRNLIVHPPPPEDEISIRSPPVESTPPPSPTTAAAEEESTPPPSTAAEDVLMSPPPTNDTTAENNFNPIPIVEPDPMDFLELVTSPRTCFDARVHELIAELQEQDFETELQDFEAEIVPYYHGRS